MEGCVRARVKISLDARPALARVLRQACAGIAFFAASLRSRSLGVFALSSESPEKLPLFLFDTIQSRAQILEEWE